MKLRGLFAEIKLPIRRLLLGLGAFILMAVAGLAWFQYQQVDRVTQGSALGRDNFVWEFYGLELQLIRY